MKKMRSTSSYKAATLHDVAEKAGVSLITASRAISNPKLVSESTIARVKEAVAATGYIPNLMAGGLKSRKSFLVACVVPSIAVPQFLPTVHALTDALSAVGYQVILGQSGYDHSNEEALLNTMISRRPDGIVFTGLIQSESVREQLRKVGIPVVETWDLSDRPVDMIVGFSHIKVGSAIAGYFLSKGWKKIGVATGNDQRAMERCEGFMAVIGRKLPTALVPAPSGLELGRNALVDLLQQDPTLEAIYCSSDQMAQGVMVEAQSRGLRIPEDLAIFGFGNSAFSAHTNPPISTVNVDGKEIGLIATQLILKRCQNEVIEQPIIDVGFQIIERESSQ